MSCPYFSSKKPIKTPFATPAPSIPTDPCLFIEPASYSLPYISPYSKSLAKYSMIKTLDFKPFPFHVQNTFFHADYIKKFRNSQFLSKISVANELRESGNRNFHKNRWEKAAACYEHALGLFKFVEVVSDTLLLMVPDIETDDASAAKGMIGNLLRNYALVLMKTKNFESAWILVQEAKEFVSPKKIAVLEAVCRANNKETNLEEIEKYAEIVQTSKEIRETFAELVKSKYMEKCHFFMNFFQGFGEGNWSENKRNFDLEVKVIQKMDERYAKMVEFYQETETLKKVIEEKNEIRKAHCQINFIIGLRPSSDDKIMKGHAKAMGIDLSLKKNIVKFENTKKNLVTEIFNKGTFNKNVLYQCFQDTMIEFESFQDSNDDKIEKEYQFWKTNLILLIILSVLIYFATNPSLF